MTTFAPDVSYYQARVDDSFARDWLIFRGCDGSFTDPNAAHNVAWCVANRGRKLTNFTVYVVYRPGMNGTILATLSRLGVPGDCVIMVDVESWGGQIRGDRSTEIGALVSALRTRQSGRPDLVWAYGNRYDLGALFPRRPGWLGLVVASYGSVKPDNPGPGPMVGWQYTDGSGRWPTPGSAPSSSAPFGHCDHNILYSRPPPADQEIDMPLTEAEIHKIAHEVWAYGLNQTDPANGKKEKHPAWQYLTAGWAHTKRTDVNVNDGKDGVLVRVARVQAAVKNLGGSK